MTLSLLKIWTNGCQILLIYFFNNFTFTVCWRYRTLLKEHGSEPHRLPERPRVNVVLCGAAQKITVQTFLLRAMTGQHLGDKQDANRLSVNSEGSGSCKCGNPDCGKKGKLGLKRNRTVPANLGRLKWFLSLVRISVAWKLGGGGF